MTERYFLCYGKLYSAPESCYHEILIRLRDNVPFNLIDFAHVKPLGNIGVDVGTLSREHAARELRRECVEISADKGDLQSAGDARK